MVLSPAVKKFSRSSMSQEVHMRAESASQNSLEKDNGFVEAASDHIGDVSVTSSHSNGSTRQKNLVRDSTPASGLYPQGKGKADQGAEVFKDSSNCPHEATKSSNEDDKEDKSVNEPDLQGHPPVKSVPCDDSEESEAMEQDVKVCDICGDTGREYLLAICCRCSDGAEHTYCMREMLQKVPEGDWLCEECKYAEETVAQKSGLVYEWKNSSKAMQVLGKRPAEEIRVACTMKKQALDVNVGSPRMSNLNGTAVSSGNSPLSMEKGKGRAVHEYSEIPRSPNTSRIQVSKNALLKSKSFSALSAKSKVKQVEEGFQQKLRGARHHSLLDTKIGSLRTLGTSASFKYVNRGGQDSLDSKVKTFPAKFANSQELKGGSREKNEHNPAGRNRLTRVDQDLPTATRSSSISFTSKLDQKLSSRSETLSSTSDSRDSSTIHSDGKPSSLLSKSSSYVARWGTNGAMGLVEPSSSDGGCNISVKKRSNHVGPKGGILSGLSCSQEKPCNSGTGSTQDGSTHAHETRNHVEKSQESSASRLGKAVTFGSRTALCEKCDESGHIAEFCPYASSQASENDVFGTKIVKGDMNYRSKSNAAVTSTMLKKPGIYRRNKALDKSGSLSETNAPATQERSTYQDILKKSENTTQLNGVNEAICSLKAGISESKWKPLLRELPAICKASIIPDHDSIWQGGLQVERGNKQMDLLGGFQAHLPACVSPKVLEIVTKFPDKITLNEVPRVSAWPVQFRDYGTKEDHIALYIFARDLESYERNYKGLLDNMMKCDLALKGDLGTAELLIFPSNQLPEKSQRWNMSFFLWGVFKGGRANGLDHGVGEGESSRKKQKTDSSGTRECNGSNDANLLTDGFAHKVNDLNNSSAVAENVKQVHDLKDRSALVANLKQVHDVNDCSAENLKQIHDLNDCSSVAENVKQVHDLNDCSALAENLKQVLDLNECSALAENLKSEDFGDGVTVKGMESAERHLFTVNSQDPKESKTGDSSITWEYVSSLENEVTCHAGVPAPDLNLALGAETKSASKGFSFLVDQRKPSSASSLAPVSKVTEEDDPSASLTLSLSFPSPGKERGSFKSFPKKKLLHEGTL